MEPLIELLTKLEGHNEVLAIARGKYLAKEAQRKYEEARLVKEAVGKSHAEKVTLAQSSKEWLIFHRELSQLESDYQYELFKHEILKLEYQARYLLQKQDGDLIGRPKPD